MSDKSARRKSLIVSESLQRRVKVRAAALGRSVQAVVEEALTAWLNETARVTDVDQTRVITLPEARWCPVTSAVCPVVPPCPEGPCRADVGL